MKWERTEEQIRAIVEGYKEGMTLRELAIRHKLGRDTVSKLLKEAGVRLRKSGLTLEEIEEAKRLYSQGSSLAVVARRFEVDPKTVWSRLTEQGIKMRDTHGRQR